MSDIQNIGSALTESLIYSSKYNGKTNSKYEEFQERLKNMPSVLDESTLTKLRNGDYEISLREYTSMSSYNAMMTALYGNNSADPFQNILNIATESKEDSLANAKSFIEKMKENGMSNSRAVRTYSALKKYSLMTSFKNYNFIKTSV